MTEQGTSTNGRWRWFFAVLSVALVASLLMMAGCSSDDEDEDTGGDSQPTTTKTTGSGDKTPDPADDGGDDAASDLSALAENYEDFTGVISYKTTGFGDGFTTMKIYKGENASRVDYESAEGTGSIISTDGAIYLCGEGVCIKYPTGDSSLDPTAGLTALISAQSIAEVYGDIPDGVDVEKSSEKIAGVDATCYTYSGDIDETTDGDESGAICVSESGLLLRLKFDGDEGGQFEATEAEDDISDADFEPPFPVTELPNFGQ